MKYVYVGIAAMFLAPPLLGFASAEFLGPGMIMGTVFAARAAYAWWIQK